MDSLDEIWYRLFQTIPAPGPGPDPDPDPDPGPSQTTIYDCRMCSKGASVFVHEDDGTLVCSACGAINNLIVEKHHDQPNDTHTNSCISIYLPKSTLGTSISGSPWMRLRKVNEWWKWVYKEKSFFDDKKHIESRCHAAGLSKAVIDNSLILYKKISESRHDIKDSGALGRYVILRGMSRRAIMAASVYYGARFQHQPCTPKEIADIFNLDINHITRGCKRFQSLIDLKELIRRAETNETIDYVRSFSFRKNLSTVETNIVLTIVKNIEKLQIATNHQPPVLAAASLLIMADLLSKKISRSDIATIFKVSDSTVTKTFKELYPFFRIITNSSLTDEYLKDMSAAANA